MCVHFHPPTSSQARFYVQGSPALSRLTNNYCGYAALTLLFYEYVITLDREVNLFWTRKFTGATALFLANRYIPLLLQIVDMCGYATMSDKVIMQYVPWAVFSALRVYALSGRNSFLGLVTLLLSSVTVGVNLTQYHWLVGFNDPTNVTIASRTCTIAADIIVIVVTLFATYRAGGFVFGGDMGRTFSAVLLEYGTILTILNALHLTFTLVSFGSDSISPVSYVTVFTEPITAVIVSRFLFGLQEANNVSVGLTGASGSETHQGSSSRTSTLNFARVVGPLGSSLTTRDEGFVDADEEVAMNDMSKERQSVSGAVTFTLIPGL
ncbi:hypothetical protein C8Q77DRAFT_1067287 [Trametes polyzona]|nr:hypothetical protein C8Q77DRAFT_1067287 [Trametes polyzona]